MLDGVELLGLASKPRTHGKTLVKTLWGELAWQLGGAEAYALVKEADENGTAPGKGELSAVLASQAPCIVLMDELVRYVSQFEEGIPSSKTSYASPVASSAASTSSRPPPMFRTTGLCASWFCRPRRPSAARLKHSRSMQL